MVPRSLKLERWRGLPHINKVRQFESVLFFKVNLFLQFIQAGFVLLPH